MVNRIMWCILRNVMPVLAVVLAIVTPAWGITILPLGDSITQANNTHLSYRYNLWTKLIDDGRLFDLVGSLDNNFNGDPTWPPYLGQNFDQDHEGHWGWRTDQILNGRTGQGSISEWLAYYTPDVVLIHIGSNDVYQGQSTVSSVTEIKAIIDTLRTDNPNVTIFLAKLIPINSDTYNPRIIALNAEMDGIAANKSTVDSPVWVVDQYSGFDAAADTYDNVHPDASGEEKMAQKWHDAMQTYLNPCMDGLDNDDDGFIDYPSDPDCTSPHSDEEKAVLTLPTGKCTNASP
jgi:lysophospholipase L1-like esterase